MDRQSQIKIVKNILTNKTPSFVKVRGESALGFQATDYLFTIHSLINDTIPFYRLYVVQAIIRLCFECNFNQLDRIYALYVCSEFIADNEQGAMTVSEALVHEKLSGTNMTVLKYAIQSSVHNDDDPSWRECMEYFLSKLLMHNEGLQISLIGKQPRTSRILL